MARAARAQGWTITVTGGGHLKWKPEHGPAVITGSTPQRYGHASRNARRALTRAGLGAKGSPGDR
jgi:hypothetical protein